MALGAIVLPYGIVTVRFQSSAVEPEFAAEGSAVADVMVFPLCGVFLRLPACGQSRLFHGFSLTARRRSVPVV